jgi:hypothetical protein
MRHAPPFAVVCLLSSAVWLTACAGARPPDPGGPPRPAGGPPAYETFDPAGYDARPAPVRTVVEHDVPPRLMEGTVEVPDDEPDGTPEPRTVQGFRVQVFTSEDRAAAERTRAAVEAWAQTASGAARGLRGEVAYLEPYYRVRLGAFASREEAEAALAAVRAAYPEAFLVPDLVTVYE